jgi:hypothetical protein
MESCFCKSLLHNEIKLYFWLRNYGVKFFLPAGQRASDLCMNTRVLKPELVSNRGRIKEGQVDTLKYRASLFAVPLRASRTSRSPKLRRASAGILPASFPEVRMTYRHPQTMKMGTAGFIMVRARLRINVV